MTAQRFVVWDKADRYGTEYADVSLEGDRMSATGTAIGWDPLAYVMEYDLATGVDWVTSRLRVRSRGAGWHRSLDLRRSADGGWSVKANVEGDADLLPSGGDVVAIDAALDCDLGLSPLTNAMPVLRHNLLQRNGSHEFVMAWVSVPDLGVHASGQRYTTRGEDAEGRRIIEYSSIKRDFVADLTFDADGLVVDYPRLGRRVP